MTPRTFVPLAVIATSLLVAACSSSTTSGKGAAHTTASTTSTTAASSPPASTAPATSAAATSGAPSTGAAGGPDLAALLVQPSDLPAGWKVSPPSSTADDQAEKAAMVACVGGKNTADDRLSRAEKDYDQGNNDITSNAQLMKSQADVAADTALLRSPKINSCYEQMARQQIGGSLPAGDKLGAVNFTVTPGSNGGPKNLVAIGHGTVTITVSGQTVTVYVEVAFITGNRIEGEVDFTGVGARIDTTLEETLVTKVAQRIANA